MTLTGFKRKNGQVGIRNYVLVIPTSICATEVCAQIAFHVEGAVSLANQHGCGQIGRDLEQTVNVLINLGKHANVGGVLVVGLGCEGVSSNQVAEEIAKTGKPVEVLSIQDYGGTVKTTAKGVELAKKLVEEISHEKRQPIPWQDILLGLDCGGSDTTSGLSANPVLGYVTDKILASSASAIFSETPEIIGAEHLLANRAVSKEVAEKIYEVVARTEAKALTSGVDLRGGNPTPGNIRGGITTIEEKSLGCIYKAGSFPLVDVLEYGQAPTGSGLFFMDTPGQDVESMTGKFSGGCQISLFSTGMGTPTGFPIAPVIKVCGNTTNYKRMEDNLDMNAGEIIEGKETIAQAGERLYDLLVDTINGKLTKAEQLGHREFGIYKILSTF